MNSPFLAAMIAFLLFLLGGVLRIVMHDALYIQGFDWKKDRRKYLISIFLIALVGAIVVFIGFTRGEMSFF